MARKLRIQYPGAIYHVMNRGDHQEVIFCDDDDRQLFLSTLAEGCQKTSFHVHSFCLMSNHFHLVVEPPHANLVEGMKWLLGVDTSRYRLTAGAVTRCIWQPVPHGRPGCGWTGCWASGG